MVKVWLCDFKMVQDLAKGFLFLIGILDLITSPTYSGFLVLAERQVECYECVWQNSASLQSPNSAQDFCRPGHFRRDRVNVVSCPQACITTTMFENDPDGPITTSELRKDKDETDGSLESSGLTSSGASSNDKPEPPMSFFMRGCPNGDNKGKKDGCEEKSYFNIFREECFCTTHLCNEANPTQRLSITMPFLIIIAIKLWHGRG